MNPTNDVLEKRVAALEGGLACVTVGSGQAASTFAITNCCQAGDNFISSTDLYGGTVNLFTHTLKKFGIEVRYADPLIQKILKNKLMRKLDVYMLKLYQIHIYVFFQLKKWLT